MPTPSADQAIENRGPGWRAATHFTPDHISILGELERAFWNSAPECGGVERLVRLNHAVSQQNGLPPLRAPVDDHLGDTPARADDLTTAQTPWRERNDLSADELAVLRYAEQSCLHVGSLSESERTEFIAALGPDCGAVAQAIFVADMLPRALFALDLLFAEESPPANETAPGLGNRSERTPNQEPSLASATEALIRRVPSLEHLDPVTTELVRLLGARFHNCRVCLSVRSQSAFKAGADDALFAEVDRYATSHLPENQKAALAFADTLLATPSALTSEDAARLRSQWSPEACVELVLDITRNATNKIAVGLAADAPRVEEGYEIYDVKPDGEIHYGLGHVSSPASA